MTAHASFVVVVVMEYYVMTAIILPNCEPCVVKILVLYLCLFFFVYNRFDVVIIIVL
ncbi:hypothetical protein T492DRAFT_958358 [Pavlovales sp. CCMP2436]|nr:hypothetical protein T492DRAFT_958358 [Pavlovales sp. CCMP2436]